MKCELKNVKYSKAMSQETNAFTATLYIDGKKAAQCRNEGCGGPTDVYFDDAALHNRFKAFCASLPPVVGDYKGATPLAMDAELYVGELLEAHLILQEKKRWCRKSTVFRLKTDKKGEYRTINRPYVPEAKTALLAKYGDQLEVIVNEEIA